jgi:hypothetical protein
VNPLGPRCQLRLWTNPWWIPGAWLLSLRVQVLHGQCCLPVLLRWLLWLSSSKVAQLLMTQAHKPHPQQQRQQQWLPRLLPCCHPQHEAPVTAVMQQPAAKRPCQPSQQAPQCGRLHTPAPPPHLAVLAVLHPQHPLRWQSVLLTSAAARPRAHLLLHAHCQRPGRHCVGSMATPRSSCLLLPQPCRPQHQWQSSQHQPAQQHLQRHSLQTSRGWPPCRLQHRTAPLLLCSQVHNSSSLSSSSSPRCQHLHLAVSFHCTRPSPLAGTLQQQSRCPSHQQPC